MKIAIWFVCFGLMTSAFAVLPADLQGKFSDMKKKACPIVNGKEDCTVQELKDKAVEIKSKYIKK